MKDLAQKNVTALMVCRKTHRETERKRVKSQETEKETEYVISMKLLLPQAFGDGNQNNLQADVVVVVADLEDKEEELQLNTLIFCHGGDP